MSIATTLMRPAATHPMSRGGEDVTTKFKHQGHAWEFERTGRGRIELRVSCLTLGTFTTMWVDDNHPTMLLREQVVEELQRRERLGTMQETVGP